MELEAALRTAEEEAAELREQCAVLDQEQHKTEALCQQLKQGLQAAAEEREQLESKSRRSVCDWCSCWACS